MAAQFAQIGFYLFYYWQFISFLINFFSSTPSRTHHCVGVVEGSVLDDAPTLPSSALREFPDFKELGERELQGICEHLSNRFFFFFFYFISFHFLLFSFILWDVFLCILKLN